MRIVVIGLVALGLSGCSVESARLDIVPAVTAPAAEAVPREGVEQRAIDAVTVYLQTSAEIAADGGERPERIGDVVTVNWLPEELVGFESLRALGVTQIGAPLLTRTEVAAIRGIAQVTEVVVHACTTLTGVTVRTNAGIDVPTQPSTSLVTVYVVPENGVLKVDGIEPWADTTWCDAA